MNRRLLAFGLLILLFALSACQPQTAVGAAANLASANKSFSSDTIPVTGGFNAGQLTFASPRYSYSLAYPEGWQVIEEPGFLEKDHALAPGNPGTDTYSSPDGRQNLALGMESLPDGVTLQDYTQAGLNQVSQQYFTCGAPVDREAVTIGGSAGRLFSYQCSDGYFLMVAFAVRGQTGLTAVWQSPTGHAVRDQAQFEKMIGSLILK